MDCTTNRIYWCKDYTQFIVYARDTVVKGTITESFSASEQLKYCSAKEMLFEFGSVFDLTPRVSHKFPLEIKNVCAVFPDHLN